MSSYFCFLSSHFQLTLHTQSCYIYVVEILQIAFKTIPFQHKNMFQTKFGKCYSASKLFNNFIPHLGEREGVEIQNWLRVLTASLVLSMNVEMDILSCVMSLHKNYIFDNA